MSYDQVVDEFIRTQGISCTYKKTTLGSFDTNTMMASSTTVDHIIKVYPKQIRATKYYLPNLIGKEITMFYIRATNSGFVPDLKDTIIYNSKTYLVDSYSEHVADGAILLYKVIAVKA